MASCRARPRSSSSWRDAPRFAFDLPRFFNAGTDNPARMPRIEITTSNSISVNPDWRFATFTTTTFKKHLLPAHDVVFVDAGAGCRVQVNFSVRSGGPDHHFAIVTKIVGLG